MTKSLRAAVAIWGCLLCACATTASEPTAGAELATEIQTPEPEVSEEETTESDPLEPVNRGIFWFDDGLDRVLFEPLAIGWSWITPEVFRIHLGKCFDNLGFPVRFVNNLFQLDARQTGRELGRFVVNSTVGLAGFFDPGTGWGLEKRDEDFGQTLGRWGVPAGPYLVLPLLGPSSVRDGFGYAVDTPLRVTTWLWFLRPPELINSRALLLDDIRELRRASLDYYVSVRNAYTQHRQAQVANGEVATEETYEDLYEVIDDDE
jgi:phospholipid-binding lipoprotein MlaA